MMIARILFAGLVKKLNMKVIRSPVYRTSEEKFVFSYRKKKYILNEMKKKIQGIKTSLDTKSKTVRLKRCEAVEDAEKQADSLKEMFLSVAHKVIGEKFDMFDNEIKEDYSLCDSKLKNVEAFKTAIIDVSKEPTDYSTIEEYTRMKSHKEQVSEFDFSTLRTQFGKNVEGSFKNEELLIHALKTMLATVSECAKSRDGDALYVCEEINAPEGVIEMDEVKQENVNSWQPRKRRRLSSF